MMHISRNGIDEVWKDVQGYEGLYQVSNLGRIKSLGRYVYNSLTQKDVWQPERIRKTAQSGSGYWSISLYKEGVSTQYSVHRLVAQAFVENQDPSSKDQVDHIDGNKDNNCSNNLRWCTARENKNNPVTVVKSHGASNPFYGKHHSEETKSRIRNNNHKALRVRNVTTGEIFESVHDAANQFNKSHSVISEAIKRRRIYRGCYWEYV